MFFWGGFTPLFAEGGDIGDESTSTVVDRDAGGDDSFKKNKRVTVSGEMEPRVKISTVVIFGFKR